MTIEAVHSKFDKKGRETVIKTVEVEPWDSFFGTRSGDSPQGGWFEAITLTVLPGEHILIETKRDEGGEIKEKRSSIIPTDQINDRPSRVSVNQPRGEYITLKVK